MIDSHLHLWDFEVGVPSWLGPEHGPIHRSILPSEAETMHAVAGYTGAVLVQVDDTNADTDYMLSVAGAHPWVLGVVGWVDLASPDPIRARLEQLGTTNAGTGKLAGIRHLVHADPRADFLDGPRVRQGLRVLAGAGLPLDIPDAFPRHLLQATRLAADLPDLVIVIDHLAKPPADGLGVWREQLEAIATRENVVAKVSGLHHGGTTLDPATTAAALEIALGAFGADRLMIGSDWPMPLLGDSVELAIAQRDAFLDTLSPDERALVAGGVARRIYHLPAY